MGRKGRLSNPIQRRLCPTEIGELIAAYRAGATINELADRYGLRSTTVAATLDRHHVERHHSESEWTSETLAAAADLYATGLSLAAVAGRYGIDAQTVANRFRRARIPTRPRRGWPPRCPT
jgi:lambda repressor-like predicted transcriptional regulator